MINQFYRSGMLVISLLLVQVVMSHAGIWDWEDGTLQGWRAKREFNEIGDTLMLSNTTERAFHGSHSMKWHIQGTKIDMYWYAAVENPRVNPGETVYYRVWVPAGMPINGLKTFLKDNNRNWVDGIWYGYTGLQKNAWNELTIRVPQTGAFPILEVGLQVVASVQTVDITVYLDYVVCGLPNPPSGLTAVARNLSEIALNWNDNTEPNFAYYKIYRDTISDFEISPKTFIDRTTISEFLDTGLKAYTKYYYKLTAVDLDEDESLPSAQVSATTFDPNAPPIVTVKQVNATTVGLYEKFEAILDLKNADYLNPYNPEEIDVQANFIAPSGRQWKIFGFYDNYQNQDQWKVRFAPNEIGQWNYTIRATDKDGTGQSQSYQFMATASPHHGWLHVSRENPHYLEHDDGTSFYGVGIYVAWNLTVDRLYLLQVNGANSYGMWNINYGGYISSYGLIENELGKYNQPKCGRIDEMLEMSEQRGLYVMFCFWPHDLLSNTVWAHLWDQNPYRLICDVKDVYRDSLCWEYQKKQYRYLIARWGHSRALGIWEIINEINGTDGWVHSRPSDALAWVKKVHDYFQEHDPYDHPTTASKSGGYNDYEPLLAAYTDLPNLHFYEYQGWPVRSPDNLFWSSIQNFAFAAQRFWNSFPKPAIIGEAGVLYELQKLPKAPIAYHNALWTCLTNGLAMTPFWWKLDQVDASLLARMRPFSKFVAAINFKRESKKHFEASTEQYDLFGMHGDSTAFGWIRDRKGGKINQSIYSFPDVLKFEKPIYKIDYYDPWLGQWFASRIATVANAQIIDKVPKANADVPDVAFRLSSGAGGIIPVRLQLMSYVDQLDNSPSSRAEVLCYVIDSNGKLCENANSPITFALEGPGQISHSQITATNGIATIQYQAGTDVGEALIIASAPRLWPDTLRIQVKNLSKIEAENHKIPNGYWLEQNYPNPFNAATTIRYFVPTSGLVTITVYNTSGQVIANLIDRYHTAGEYAVRWDANEITSGIYFIRLKASMFEQTRKCLLLR